jgi:hypothetical protein
MVSVDLNLADADKREFQKAIEEVARGLHTLERLGQSLK